MLATRRSGTTHSCCSSRRRTMVRKTHYHFPFRGTTIFFATGEQLQKIWTAEQTCGGTGGKGQPLGRDAALHRSHLPDFSQRCNFQRREGRTARAHHAVRTSRCSTCSQPAAAPRCARCCHKRAPHKLISNVVVDDDLSVRLACFNMADRPRENSVLTVRLLVGSALQCSAHQQRVLPTLQLCSTDAAISHVVRSEHRWSIYSR